MPLGLLEAMSYRSYCVVSNISKFFKVIQDKAVIFEKSNVLNLKDELKNLCNNSDLTNVHKENASEYICNKYNWNDVIKRTLELYQQQ